MRPLSSLAAADAAAYQTTGLRRDATDRAFSAESQALIEGFRMHGYRRAAINPLDSGSGDAAFVAELDPLAYGLVPEDPSRCLIHLGGAAHTLSLGQLLAHLRWTYCGPISLESTHVRSGEQRRWLYEQMETRADAPQATPRDVRGVLARLAAAEAFEQHHRAHHAAYKQFSLEGSESIVIMVRAVIEAAAQHGVEDLVMGMPHRGRLNLMLNALDVPGKDLLTLFSSNPEPCLAASDLKDHAGVSRRVETVHRSIRVLLAHNPSHLESVSPVVCGMARALLDRKTVGSSKTVMPMLMHGDASFCGQGIVTETLNLSQTRGYGVGGTVHVILNNQIGSTVSHPRDARSTLHGADVARAIDAPVLHVNADDPDAVLYAARLATEFRMRFGADIVVDHVGYRRQGHFVGDDPTFTQPGMQRRIRAHRTVVELYAERMQDSGLLDAAALDRARREAEAALAEVQAASLTAGPRLARSAATTRESRPVRTAVSPDQLRSIISRLATVPAGFALHADVQKMLAGWQSTANEPDRPVDWRLAENLAYASLLANGFNVRLTGLDVGRGTFLHRQHVWHDQSTEADWHSLHVPLRGVADAQGIFSIFDSPLSEEAVLGFEYGYALQSGRDLVVWEAQFGDFVNNAQVIIDQFIASGEAKWGYECGLVVLLPHGYDGWGPEHSSAYLGRFLELCADGNMIVAMPSNPSQMYHLLRRQALMDVRKPLVVMTPKPWLYGHAPSYSQLADLAQAEFSPLLRDAAEIDRAQVVRVVVTSGKLYYDLAAERSRAGVRNVPIERVEQLYPFPVATLTDALRRYPDLREVVWAQEEAKNHGAWHHVRESLEAALPRGVSVRYAGRPAAAASAVCNAAQHGAERQDLVADALGLPRS